MDPDRLHLYEEIMLLALRDREGTLTTGFAEYAVAGALVAEMLYEGRIAMDGTRKQLIDLRNREPTGDPILDEAVKRMGESPRRASLKTWITRLARAKGLRHRVARQLCRRGILRADEDTVLLLFRRRIYPEVNPMPETLVIERMREAIATSEGAVDPNTIVLISLAKGADLLTKALGRDLVKRRKERIKAIVAGEAAGKATKEIIEACQAAVMVAAVMPAVIGASHR